MLSHGNLLANAQHNLVATGHRAGQRWLHVCPMFHVAGIANLIACTWVGRGAGRCCRASTPPPCWRRSSASGSPTPCSCRRCSRMLLDAPGADDADLSSLRHVQYAASPISAELQRRVLERLPDCDVAQFYGMTEAAPTVTHLSAEDHRRGGERLASVGIPVPGVEVDVARRRAVDPRPERHARLLEPPGRDRRGAGRRLVPLRRRRHRGRATATCTCSTARRT